jgi:hypothetical protein
MRFKDFLSELAMPVDPSLAIDVVNEELINEQLAKELSSTILSPQIGFYKIRKVLRSFGYDMSTSYEIETDGDEVILNIVGTDSLLYVLYYISDSGSYDFYALVDDEEGIEELISADEDLEEED